MSVDSLGGINTAPVAHSEELPIMDMQDMKRILMLGIRGEVVLPPEEHEVDVYA
ncbi:hypothetical protein [Marispirochaeta sp.]|uniref:hypothetical protein n=1 Tax=Marispirochaeta sp. TaxID=2038653 RepID=UPI0029C9AFC6|nr:hypothetical protein [Marispirochaeta sp.]